MKSFKVNDLLNMCWVFEIPLEYPEGYCHGGGLPTNFQMIDWFYPLQFDGIKTVTIEGEEYENQINATIEFIKKKQYIKKNRQYIVITAYGDSIVFGESEYQSDCEKHYKQRQGEIKGREIAEEIAKNMQCNCDLDKWEPTRMTGHSDVCRIHKAAIEEMR